MKNNEKIDVIDFLKDIYSFFEFDSLEKKKIIENINGNNEFNYNLTIKKVREIIRDRLNTPVKMANFINSVFDGSKHISEQEFFAQLISLLEKVGINPSCEVWELVLKNNEFVNNLVAGFVNKNIDYIQFGYVSDFFDNSNIILLIKTYAYLNSIDLEVDKCRSFIIKAKFQIKIHINQQLKEKRLKFMKECNIM